MLTFFVPSIFQSVQSFGKIYQATQFMFNEMFSLYGSNLERNAKIICTLLLKLWKENMKILAETLTSVTQEELVCYDLDMQVHGHETFFCPYIQFLHTHCISLNCF